MPTKEIAGVRELTSGVFCPETYGSMKQDAAKIAAPEGCHLISLKELAALTSNKEVADLLCNYLIMTATRYAYSNDGTCAEAARCIFSDGVKSIHYNRTDFEFACGLQTKTQRYAKSGPVCVRISTSISLDYIQIFAFEEKAFGLPLWVKDSDKTTDRTASKTAKTFEFMPDETAVLDAMSEKVFLDIFSLRRTGEEQK